MFRRIDGKLEVQYPCTWVYKIFGTDREEIRAVVAEIISGKDYSLTPSRSSATGKYHCMNLKITVESDEERTWIYEAISGHQAIVLVL